MDFLLVVLLDKKMNLRYDLARKIGRPLINNLVKAWYLSRGAYYYRGEHHV